MMKVKLEVLLCALSLCPQAFVFGQGVANDLAGVDKDDIAAMMKRGRKRSVKRSFALRIGHRSEPNFQSRQPRFSEPAKNIANTVNIAGENRDKENRELADFDEAAFWNTYLVGQTDSFPPTGTPPTPHPTTKVETDEPTNAPVSVPMVPTNEPTKSPLPPPTFVPSAVGVPTASPIECKSIAEIACSNPDEFGALCELVNRADLVEPLTNDFLTVFAPTNDALTALPMEVVGPLLEDVGLLREVLWYHVVPSVEIRTTDLVCEGGELDTLTMANGENTTVSCGTRDEPETFILGNGNIEPGAQIIVKNVNACNGIIQVINGVLFPRFTESPTSAPVQQTESPVDVTSAPVAPPTDAPVAPVPDPTPAPVAPPTDAPVAPVPDPTPAPVAPPTDAPVAPVPDPTPAPVAPPTDAPVAPVPDPTPAPVAPPTDAPVAPVPDPTPAPVPPPTNAPTASPTVAPITPTAPPTASPTVAPTAAPTVAPTLAPTPSPTAAPVPPTPAPIAGPPVVLQAIEPVALQGGSEFTDPNSYQSMALARTEEVPGINDLSSAKIIQYYALYSIFMATNSVSNIITESEGILDIPSWIVSRGWDSTSDPCTGNWFGVECVEDQVTGLNIFNNLLTGAFPPEVTLLASDGPRSTGAGALEVIDLFDNMLLTNNGDNSWWADLGSGFRRLFFRSTAFTGSLGRLPDNIAEFDCSLTFISGGLTNENFQGLNSLRYAELSGNAFNTSVPSAFTQMQSLELLYLQDSFISGDLSYMIGMTSLREHWIDANPGLGGTIPPQLGNIAPLQSLSITSCSLSGSIPPELGNIGGVMQNFWVYDNDLTGTIPAELGSWAGVEILQVEGNSFTGSMPQSVCDRLSFPGRLTTLGADCFDPNFSCDCCTCCSIQECPI